MALLGNSRRVFRDGDDRSRNARVGRSFGLFAAVAVALLALSRLDSTALAPFQGAVIGWSSPLVGATSRRLAPLTQTLASLQAAISARHDIEQLRVENAHLTVLAATAARLERENRELRQIANYVGTSSQGASNLSADVVSTSANPLSRTVIINAGVTQGVRSGVPVTNEAMLIGRVLEAQAHSASVMLLSDRLSRVPVQIGGHQTRAVLSGNGSRELLLEFLANEATITAGDLVTTSGLGGVFPRGLIVGSVAGTPARWTIGLSPAQETPELVSVLTPPPSDTTKVPAAAFSASSPALRPQSRESPR